MIKKDIIFIRKYANTWEYWNPKNGMAPTGTHNRIQRNNGIFYGFEGSLNVGLTVYSWSDFFPVGNFEYADSCSGGYTPPQTSVLGMTPNYMELWVILSTASFPLLPGLLWHGVLVPVRGITMGQIEIYNHFLNLEPFYWMLNRITCVEQ